MAALYVIQVEDVQVTRIQLSYAETVLGGGF